MNRAIAGILNRVSGFRIDPFAKYDHEKSLEPIITKRVISARLFDESCTKITLEYIHIQTNLKYIYFAIFNHFFQNTYDNIPITNHINIP